MSLNLNYRVAKHGAWADRLARIAQAARERQVDVMALQAVEGAGGGNQAAELAEALGFGHLAFVAAMKQQGIARGSAFVSRYPLGEIETRRLATRNGHEDPTGRVLLCAKMETRAGRLDLYNAHFSWVPVQALDNAHEALAFRRNGRALFLGDLNSPPGSPALKALERGGWIDLWAGLRPGEPGFTFESDGPTQRIDYALADSTAWPRVRSIERVATGNTGTPRLSDHLGLVLTLDDEARH